MEKITLKEVTISGFRGYGAEEQTVDLSLPVTLIAGKNHSGKSSTLNAVEWALFGDEVASKKLGIEERKYWLTKTRECDTAVVELVISSGDGEIRVHRELGGERGKKGSKFFFVDELGEIFKKEEELWEKLGMRARDFMASVYLHQEVIRDILVSEPSVRRDAISRLIGVSDLNNLHMGMKGFRKKVFLDKVDQAFEGVEKQRQAKLEIFRGEIELAKEEGRELGLSGSDYSREGYLEVCRLIQEKLEGLAEEAEIGEGNFEVPADSGSLSQLQEYTRAAVHELRSLSPATVLRNELYQRKSELEHARGKLGSLLAKRSRLDQEKEELEADGELEEILARQEELSREENSVRGDMERSDARTGVISQTIDYLEKLEDRAAVALCPACGQEIDPARLLGSLKAEVDGMGSEAREMAGRLKEVQGEAKSLRNKAERLKDIVELEMLGLDREMEDLKASLLLDLEMDTGKVADLEKTLEEELAGIDDRLVESAGALDAFERHLSEVETLLDKARNIHGVLVRKKKMEEIDSIKEMQEWEALLASREALNEELEAIDTVVEAVGNVFQREMDVKLMLLKNRLDDCFRALVKRPDFDGIQIDGESFEVYAVKGSRKQKATTFFSQGDMNCAALSIFLALAGSADGGSVSFLMLDDPSQSLDTDQKERLAEVIGDAAVGKQLVLATMDEEFLSFMKHTAPADRVIYRLGEWDHRSGPSFTRE